MSKSSPDCKSCVCYKCSFVGDCHCPEKNPRTVAGYKCDNYSMTPEHAKKKEAI